MTTKKFCHKSVNYKIYRIFNDNLFGVDFWIVLELLWQSFATEVPKSREYAGVFNTKTWVWLSENRRWFHLKLWGNRFSAFFGPSLFKTLFKTLVPICPMSNFHVRFLRLAFTIVFSSFSVSVDFFATLKREKTKRFNKILSKIATRKDDPI